MKRQLQNLFLQSPPVHEFFLPLFLPSYNALLKGWLLSSPPAFPSPSQRPCDAGALQPSAQNTTTAHDHVSARVILGQTDVR